MKFKKQNYSLGDRNSPQCNIKDLTLIIIALTYIGRNLYAKGKRKRGCRLGSVSFGVSHLSLCWRGQALPDICTRILTFRIIKSMSPLPISQTLFSGWIIHNEMRWYSYYFWEPGLNFTQVLIQLPIRALMDCIMYLLLCLTPIIIVLQLCSLPFSYHYSAYTITPVPKHGGTVS